MFVTEINSQAWLEESSAWGLVLEMERTWYVEYSEYMHNAFVEVKFSQIVEIKYTSMWLPKNVRH